MHGLLIVLVSLVAEHALGHTASVVVVCRLNFSAACGILVPRPGMESAFPALEGRFLTSGPPGKSLKPSPFFKAPVSCT